MDLPTGICVPYFFFKPTPAILSLVGTAALHDKSGKSKAEWNALYVEAGCMEKTFLQREICKTKVFQKTNWQSGKEQITGFFNKLDLSND